MRKICLIVFIAYLGLPQFAQRVWGNGQSEAAQDDVNASKRVDQWRREAEQGDGRAMYFLSIAYRRGIGVAKDDAMAVRWCRNAADAGYRDAVTMMGVM